MHWAAQKENDEILRILISFGADPNKVDFEGASPLHVAGDSSNPKCVQILINAGADPNIRSHFGARARDICVNRGYEKYLTPDIEQPVVLYE